MYKHRHANAERENFFFFSKIINGRNATSYMPRWHIVKETERHLRKTIGFSSALITKFELDKMSE